MDRRPRVSRETRQLLGIVVVSVAVLWGLARLRFPDEPPTPNPVPPVLAQFAPASPFDTIAAAVADLVPQVQPLLTPLTFKDPATGRNQVRAGLPFRDGLALTSAPAGAPRSEGAELVAMDRVSRLALVRVSANPAPVRVWSRPRTAAARYLVAADMSSGELFLRPVFVGPLTDVRAPAWRGDIWALSETTDLSDGTFVFALDGSLAGLAVTAADGRALVPADTLLAAAGALAQSERPPCGDLGIQVQALLPRVKEAIGSDGALAVAWVDPRGPAAGQLATADVLQALDGETVNSIDDWRARMERVAPGELVQLRVQRGGQAIDVAVTAREKPAAADERALGLRLRNRNNLGAEVTAVDRGSAAARAGVVPGDLITMIGEVPAPTPDDVRRVFKAAAGRPVLAAVTRGDDHLLVALEKAP